MSDKRSKLEETLDLPPSEAQLVEELEKKYEFSSDPDLKEIAKLGLTAYKEQMLDIMNMEPKYRSRALEVAQQYLNLAKDALAKDEDIRLKQEKQDQGKKDTKDEDEEKETLDRNEVLMEINNLKKAK